MNGHTFEYSWNGIRQILPIVVAPTTLAVSSRTADGRATPARSGYELSWHTIAIVSGSYTAAEGNTFHVEDDGKALMFTAPLGSVTIGD